MNTKNKELPLEQPVLNMPEHVSIIEQSNTRMKCIKCRFTILFITTNLSSLLIGYIFRGIYCDINHNIDGSM